ncbi:MAG: glycoside hydrolase family 5 protein [bacterium]
MENPKQIKRYQKRIMAFITGFLVVLVAGCGGGGGGISQSVSSLPRLQVVGNEIRDENGNRLVLKGVNALDPASMVKYYNHFGEEYFKKMREWGAKIVRIPVHYPAFKFFEKIEEGSYLRLLDQAVEWSARNGMYVVIDFHSIGWPPTGEYQKVQTPDPNWGQIYYFTASELKDFWKRVSRHFANDSRIAFFDLFNEPAKGLPNGQDTSLQAWLEWRDFAENLIDIIRENDPKRLVLVGGLQFAYDIRYAKDYPIRRDGVVYSVHIYPWSLMPGDWHANWDTAFGNNASVRPILVGEVGFDPNSTEEGLKGTADDFGIPLIDEYLKPRNIGWLAWNFSPEWTPCLLLNWNYEPTASGSFFKDRLPSP